MILCLRGKQILGELKTNFTDPHFKGAPHFKVNKHYLVISFYFSDYGNLIYLSEFVTAFKKDNYATRKDKNCFTVHCVTKTRVASQFTVLQRQELLQNCFAIHCDTQRLYISKFLQF